MANGSAATIPSNPLPTQAATLDNIFPFLPNIDLSAFGFQLAEAIFKQLSIKYGASRYFNLQKYKTFGKSKQNNCDFWSFALFLS
jgi:hypothetical protein